MDYKDLADPHIFGRRSRFLGLVALYLKVNNLSSFSKTSQDGRNQNRFSSGFPVQRFGTSPV